MRELPYQRTKYRNNCPNFAFRCNTTQTMGPNIFFVITLAIFFTIDVYVYQSVKRAYTSPVLRRIYWALCILGYIYMIYSLVTFDRANVARKVLNGFMGLIMLWYVPKFLIIAVLMIEDIIRLIIGGYRRVFVPEREELTENFIPGRRKFVQNVALGLASIPFMGVIHGIWKGRYNFRIIKETVYFDDLPEAFDGFTILQVSDIHSGSFDNREKIEYGVSLIKSQTPDLFLFTGDMVNNVSDELKPWIETFRGIQAKEGQFCTLGNHDYGDYITWESEEAQAANLEELVRLEEEELGFRNLRNENVTIERDGQQIHLVGVENWGKGFHQYGDLDKALEGLSADSFKILMSHDPTHFDEVVVKHEKDVHLTLSGHTHGMQFGIEIPGFIKWSPASFRYPKWAGLYNEGKKHLYVNRGFGYLAFPGRVGIWPEITLLELKRRTA